MKKFDKTSSKIKGALESAMKEYFENHKVNLLCDLLADDVSWIGAEVNEYMVGKPNILEALMTETSTMGAQFKILNSQLAVDQIGTDLYRCHGYAEVGERTTSSKVDYLITYFSGMIRCTLEDIKIVHFHVSVPSGSKKDEGYLEQKIKSQTVELINRTNALENIIENIVGGVLFINDDELLTISFLSHGFSRLTGYTLDEIEELFEGSFLPLIFEEDVEQYRANLTHQRAHSTTYSATYRLKHKEGHVIWVDDHGKIINSSEGQPHFQSILTDVSHYIEQQEILKVSEKRYEAAVKLSGVMMLEYDVFTGHLVFYDETESIDEHKPSVTYSIEAVIEEGLIKIESAHDFREVFRKINQGEKTASCIVSADDLFGELHFYELSLVTIFDSMHRPVKAIGVRKNISQLRDLLKEEEFSRNFANEMTLVIEANITSDVVEYLSEHWVSYLGEEYLSFKKMIRIIVNHLVYLEDRGPFLARFDLEYLNQLYGQDETLMIFRYRRNVGGGQYHWNEATVNIVRDTITNDLHIRFYRKDVNEETLNENKQNEEKQLMEAVLKKAEISYEVNISRNLMVTGSEHWGTDYQIDAKGSFDERAAVFSVRAVHPKYQRQFSDTFLSKTILRNFERGVHQISIEYERLSNQGVYRWVLTVLNLFQDELTNEVKGFIYVEDINERKQYELLLLYQAEHDQMSGVYNRTTTEKLIEEIILFNAKSIHAILLIDIDLFKNVNDTYGHLIGDEMILTTARTIRKFVRDQDIVGRVGGDEFIVFMTKIDSAEAAHQRAQKICKAFSEQEIQGLPKITISVGVSVFPLQGKNFHELYLNADKALYTSKNKGRNQVN